MICEKCNRQIGPEDLTCPYCGTKNPFAQTHAENMKEFEASYQKTEHEVVEAAKKTSEWAKRAAILGALIIGIIIMSIISSINYADPDEEAKVRRESEKNIVALSEDADAYLEQGEYMEFVTFLYAHELMNFPPEEFERFRSVSYVAQDYYDCIETMESMILRSTDSEYFDRLDTDISIFSRDLEDFYQVYEAQKERETDPKYLAYIDDMKAELEAAMKTYFALDDTALEEFLALSEAQKGVKVEEVLRHE